MRHGTNHIRGLIGLCILLLTFVCGAAVFAQGGGLVAQRTRCLTIPTGRSVVLHFQRMKRVQVVEPDLIEIVVASLHDLSVYGKKAGDTTVYVWDLTGMHQIAVTVVDATPAELLIQDLMGVLGPKLKYSVACERTIVIEGELPAAEAQRAHDIIAACAKEGVQVVDLIRTEGDDQAGAAAAVAAGLAKILGDRVEYIVWNNDTLVVQGGIGDKDKLTQAHKLLAAISDPRVKIVDLLEFQDSAAEPPVEKIAQALGKDFRVWQVAGRTVAVEGSVATADQLEDLNELLAAFADQAQIVNLVRVGKPDINRAVATLQELIGNRIVVRPLDNEAIIVDGLVPSEAELTRLRDIMTGYPTGYKLVDLLRIALPEKRQVLVQVRVVDINKGDLKRLGINWGQLVYEGTGANRTVRFVDQPWLIQNMSSVLGGNGIMGNVLAIGSQLDLLRQNNAARVLSEPNLLVDDGGKATIQVGGEIPIPVAQTGGGGVGSSIAVEWKPFGVIMTIEPTILEGNAEKINLKIAPEVSSLDFSNAVTIGGFTLPALRQRKASTVLTMDNGGTLVLGGLIERAETKTLRKIPLLGDLPVIGELFKRREFINGESELIILVTLQIVDGPMPIPAAAFPQGGTVPPAPVPVAPATPAPQ